MGGHEISPHTFACSFSDKLTQRLDQTPNGKWCVVAVFFATLAWIMSLSAPVPCTFVQRHVQLNKEIQNVSPQLSAVVFQSHGVGFWGWSDQGNNCLSFEISGKKPSLGGIYNTASAFSTLTVLFGGIGMVCLWLGVCFPFPPLRFKQFGGVLVAAILFSVLTDLIFVSSVCKDDFFQYVTSTVTLADVASASCSFGTGSLLNIFGTIFLLIAAIICEASPLAKGAPTTAATAKRNSTPALLSPLGDSDRLDDRFDDEAYDDDGSAIHRERKLETERRYREMFGDDDPDADDSVLMEEKNPFASSNTMGGLDPVLEGSEHLSSDRGNGLVTKGFDKFGAGDDDDVDDIDLADGEGSKGSRSRGTRSRGSRSRDSRSRHSHYSDEEGSRGSRGSRSRDSRSYYSGDDEDRSRDSRSRGSRDSRSRGSRSHYSNGDRSYSGDDRSRSGRGSQYSGSRRSEYDDDHHHDDRSQASRSYFSHSYHGGDDEGDDRSKGEHSELV